VEKWQEEYKKYQSSNIDKKIIMDKAIMRAIDNEKLFNCWPNRKTRRMKA